MRSVVSVLTTIAFLLHFGLGCCTHHSHAAEGGQCAGHVQAATCSHHGHDYDGQPVSSSSSDDSDGPKETCNEGSCAFVVAAKVSFVKAATLVWLLPDVLDIAKSLAPSTRMRVDDSPPLLAVRLHLFHQLFLI